MQYGLAIAWNTKTQIQRLWNDSFK